ncbi:hypothetical protein [Lactobacillus delbrueckii]|uniref:hypothetical protein n=1 Tax=Lactobacillus delbrueckii TaxID=1584 RepID=UPI0017843387|nr:hypothetical protein [Lactobacillus delbrueckii]MBD5834699.1 hypothetical protein [Lactobacillus delbrueckii]
MIVYIANDSYQRERDETGTILSMTAAVEGRNQETGESLNSYVKLAKEDLVDGVTFEELTYNAKVEACKKKMIAWLQTTSK